MRVHVLRNPAGGSASSRKHAARSIGALRGGGHEVIELTGSTADDSSTALAEALAAGEVELLLVAGGDGLVHLAIQHLADAPVPLVLAPTGTGNDFATALGITSDSDIERALAGPTTAVDLLRITTNHSNPTFVASIAIAGFPADINARANTMSLPIGRQIYTVAAALELPKFTRRRINIRVDGAALVLDTAMLAIGNTSLFGGGMLACPDATATDGKLHLTSIEGVGRLGILRHLQGRAGGTADRPEVTRLVGSRIDIETPGIDIWGDGEPIVTSPATLQIVPHAINIAGMPAD